MLPSTCTMCEHKNVFIQRSDKLAVKYFICQESNLMQVLFTFALFNNGYSVYRSSVWGLEAR